MTIGKGNLCFIWWKKKEIMSVMDGECFGKERWFKDNLVCVVGNGETTLFRRNFCWRVVQGFSRCYSVSNV